MNNNHKHEGLSEPVGTGAGGCVLPPPSQYYGDQLTLSHPGEQIMSTTSLLTYSPGFSDLPTALHDVILK